MLIAHSLLLRSDVTRCAISPVASVDGSHLWMVRLHQSRLRRNALAGYALFSVKPFYISRVTAIVQRGRVTSNTRILLNLMLGNMSKSLTQSCQGHYCIKSAAKYPCASSVRTNANVRMPEYQKPNGFLIGLGCCFKFEPWKTHCSRDFLFFLRTCWAFVTKSSNFHTETSVRGGGGGRERRMNRLQYFAAGESLP